jgi:hypothetical protein
MCSHGVHISVQETFASERLRLRISNDTFIKSRHVTAGQAKASDPTST